MTMTTFKHLLATTAVLAALTSPALAQDVTVQGGDFGADGAPAISVDTPSGDITVDVGNVATIGDDAPGIDAAAFDGRADITVSGDVSTEGEDSTGVFVSATDGISIDVAGAVTTLGYQSEGVSANTESGDVDVTLTGGVSTQGVAASAVSLLTFNGDVTLVAGDVSTAGNGSGGVRVDALGGGADIRLSGVTTLGDFAGGVFITADDLAVAILDGAVATSGQNSTGIIMQGSGVGLQFTEVSASGLFSRGIQAYGQNVAVAGQSIATTGDHASGLEVEVDNGATVLAVEAISTSGLESDAVNVIAQNAEIMGDFGAVSTTGNAANGIMIESDGGPIALRVSSVATQGFGALGIELQIDAPDVPDEPGAARHGDIDLSVGTVSTEGENARGIFVEIDALAAAQEFAASLVTISADQITTLGDYAAGLVFFDASGTGSVDISVANAETSGESSYAVAANAGSRDVTVTSTGTISTAGYNAGGIIVLTSGNVDITANEITTTGGGAPAIRVRELPIAAAGDDTRFVNISAGSVTTSGRQSDAIVAQLDAAHLDLTVDEVTTGDFQSAGIDTRTETGSITIRSTSSVTTTGSWSTGISASSESGHINILANDVTTTSHYSHGISGWTRSSADMDIITLGDVHVSGANANGIQAFSWGEPDGVDTGLVTINIFGSVIASGELNDTYDTRGIYGHGVYVEAGASDVTVGTDAHLESVHGYAFVSNDREIGGSGSGVFTASEDRLSVLGTLVGDVSFGRGDDEFLIYGGADISGLGDTLGGEGMDVLQFAGWQGEINPDRFDAFEELVLTDGADVVLAGEAPLDWSLPDIGLTDSSLRLGDGVTLRGMLSVFDFDQTSALNFFDTGASSAHFVGDVFAPDGLIVSLQDGAGDDTGLVTGNVEGDLAVGIDLGIGNGSILAADRFRINGDLTGDIVLSLNPYAATGGSFAGSLIEVTGTHGEITLANGPLAWGGEVFDIDVSGAGASQNKAYASAPGQPTTVALVSLGYTPDAAGAIAVPAIIDALDSSLYQVRAARRGGVSLGGDSSLWADVRHDAFEGDVHGLGYDTEQTAVLIGADLVQAEMADGQLTGSLMFHAGESHTDLAQAALATEHVDIDTTAFGVSLGWASGSTGRYVDLAAWATDRNIKLETVRLDSQGAGASLEIGTRFDVSGSASLQPLVQVVWTDAQIDSFTDAASSGEIAPGAVHALRVRAGAVLSQSLSETWQLEATAIADLNQRNSGATRLATGYSDPTHLSGMGAEAGLRLTGSVGNWQMFGDVTGRWATGVDGADGVGARIGLARRF